ncbi:hypothetical protein K1719_015149 [Acacia pycnantha]|nr:hypothetical protein K1719_015149 [Acacia pycnantha]
MGKMNSLGGGSNGGVHLRKEQGSRVAQGEKNVAEGRKEKVLLTRRNVDMRNRVQAGDQNMENVSTYPLFTAVYASPCEKRRQQVWSGLCSLAKEINEPWLVAGDFNEIKSPMEQMGGRGANVTRCRVFNEWIRNVSSLIWRQRVLILRGKGLNGMGWIESLRDLIAVFVMWLG